MFIINKETTKHCHRSLLLVTAELQNLTEYFSIVIALVLHSYELYQ